VRATGLRRLVVVVTLHSGDRADCEPHQ
jgi:hypothetical protein